jgi:pilus assembly protein CpaF
MDVELREQLESRIRGHIRRDGIDPLVDSDRVLRLIEQEAAEFLLTEAVGDTRRLIRDVHNSVAGFGPLQRLFDDPTVEEIWLNEPTRVFVAREGRTSLTDVAFTEAEVRALVERMLRTSGRRLDLSEPFVDATLPDGSRLHVAIPDVTRRHWVINIRKFIVRPRHIRELVPRGTLTEHAARFLDASVRAGLNIIVAGGTQAGKTTLMCGLLGCIPAQERIISCEEVFEIDVDHPDWVAMQTRDPSLEGTGGIPLRRLVREALRMRPTRLIVGEVRQAEALDLLIAMNSGMPAMATVHANSAREAVTKLCTLPLLAGRNIPGEFVVPTVASSVDLVVHTRTASDGMRRVTEIAGVTGRVENGVVEMSSVFKDTGQGLERGAGYPPHADRYARCGIALAELLDPALTRVA